MDGEVDGCGGLRTWMVTVAWVVGKFMELIVMISTEVGVTVEEERNALGEDQGCHEPVDPEDLVP